MLLKNPGFSGLTIAVMTAGLGLCIYMFSFIQSVMFRPLPFENGDKMYVVEAEIDGVFYNNGSLLLHDYQEIKQQTDSFSIIGAYYPSTANLSNGDRAERYVAVNTTANLFDYTGIHPIMGRTLTPEDNQSGAQKVAVIGYRLWQDYFNGATDIIGKTVKNNGVVTEIVGVMPEGFRFPINHQVWIPMTDDHTRLSRTEAPNVSGFVLLKDDVSLEQASQEIKTIMTELEKRYPETNSRTSGYITTFKKAVMGNGSEMIIGMMLTAVLFVLILACVNVGNLLFARANERAKETAIRVALGAPQYRLIMQMMWESVIICTIGGLFGLFGAAWALELTVDTLPSLMPMEVPYFWTLELDAELIAQTTLIVLLTSFLTGIVPAWKMSRSDFNAVLRDGTRGALSKRAGRVNQILVIVEVALSCVLLCMSGVLVVLLQEVDQTYYGANLDNKLKARIGLPEISYDDDTSKETYFLQLLTRLKDKPGVKSAGAMSSLPGEGAWYTTFETDGREVIENNYPRAHLIISYTGTMQALNMPLVSGRYFNINDRKGNQRVAIVTRSLAEKYWPGEDPLGKQLRWIETDNKEWITVVGIVNHTIHGQPYSMMKHRPSIYVPYSQQPSRFMDLFIEVSGNPNDYRQVLSSTVSSVDPEVPAYNVNTIDDALQRSTGGMFFIRSLFSVFALCALLLASSGIYGVLANSTARRTQEIGIRRAIGASDEKILSMMMRQGWFQLSIGLLFGLPLGYLTSLGFVQLVGPESSNYLWVFLFIPTTIAIVVSLATFFPAKKAIQMEPSSALRYE